MCGSFEVDFSIYTLHYPLNIKWMTCLFTSLSTFYENINFIFSGPATWTEKFPEARGVRQSPVDIATSRASTGICLPPLKWDYSVNHPRSVVNPGYCWRVDENGFNSGKIYTFRKMMFH